MLAGLSQKNEEGLPLATRRGEAFRRDEGIAGGHRVRAFEDGT